jgi:hypothetical protein
MNYLILNDKVKSLLIDGNAAGLNELLDLPFHLCREACEARKNCMQILKLKPSQVREFDKFVNQLVVSLINHSLGHDFPDKLKFAHTPKF